MKNYLYLILFCFSSFIYADCSEINNQIDCENSDYCVWEDGECFRWVDDENEEWEDEEWEDECRYIENEEECLEVGCSWGEEGCFKPEGDEEGEEWDDEEWEDEEWSCESVETEEECLEKECTWGEEGCFKPEGDEEGEEWDDEEWEDEEWLCEDIENQIECEAVDCLWSEDGCFKPEEDEGLEDGQELIIGDLTGDSSLNVLDVVLIVELILNNPSDEMHQADMNQDGITNILDVVALVQAILGIRTNDATMIEVIRDINHVMISSDGYVGAVQMILSHDDDFSIDLTNDALVAEYRTYNNSTTLIVVNPGNELFYANGEFEIIETIAANGNNFIDAVIIPSLITLGDAYPNPFNPSTTFDVQVAVAGHVSLNVYNLKGNVVGSLINNSMNPGNYNVTWDASNLSSGVYLLRAETANSIATQKVTLVK